MITVEEFRSKLDYLRTCCLDHPLPCVEITEIVAHVDYEPDEATGYTLFEISNGRWGVFTESTDYTGHG